MISSLLKKAGVATVLVVASTGVNPLARSLANQNPPAQTPPATPPAGQPPQAQAPQQPGGSQGRGGGRGPLPGAAIYAQFCASCHGPTLQGGAAGSLVDGVWKFGGDDASITASIHDGRPGTAMVSFKDLINDEQIRQLVFYIKTQEGLQKGKPETKVDPEGAIIKSEKQTVKLEVVAKDLETPWGLAFLPDGRLLITERPGRLRILDKGKLSAPITGTPKVWSVQDGGMFDVEVHPDYAKNGWIYLSYSETLPGYTPPAPDPNAPAPAPGAGGGRGGPPSPPSMTVVIRGRIKDGAWVDQQEIFKAPPELYYVGNAHYGSRFLFDRQGHLFWTLGERNHPDDAQDLSKPTGKVHRINDDGSIPKDNPFVGKPGVDQSIWTYGHRNPQGLAFDPRTNELWETEHGPTGGDELNLLIPGHNYGWAVVSNGMQPGITKSAQEGMDPPKATWTPTIAPSGIAFYHGKEYPGWVNSLFISCLGGQQLRRVEIEKDVVTHQEVIFNEYGRVRDIIIGPDGYFYVALSLPGQRLSDTTAGVVIRMVPVK
jgi:glucose/arabinose dehydrogenase